MAQGSTPRPFRSYHLCRSQAGLITRDQTMRSIMMFILLTFALHASAKETPPSPTSEVQNPSLASEVAYLECEEEEDAADSHIRSAESKSRIRSRVLGVRRRRRRR